MPVQVSDYVDVVSRANELGCNVPTGFAILPRNFADAKTMGELLHEGTASTVRILLRQANIPETKIEKDGEKFPEILEKSGGEWIGPIILIGYEMYKQNPQIASIVIDLLLDYLKDWFKGVTAPLQKTKLDVVVEKSEKGNYKRVHYEGPVAGLKDLPPVIEEFMKNE